MAIGRRVSDIAQASISRTITVRDLTLHGSGTIHGDRPRDPRGTWNVTRDKSGASVILSSTATIYDKYHSTLLDSRGIRVFCDISFQGCEYIWLFFLLLEKDDSFSTTNKNINTYLNTNLNTSFGNCYATIIWHMILQSRLYIAPSTFPCSQFDRSFLKFLLFQPRYPGS